MHCFFFLLFFFYFQCSLRSGALTLLLGHTQHFTKRPERNHLFFLPLVSKYKKKIKGRLHTFVTCSAGTFSSIFASHDDPDIVTITHKFNNTVTIVVQAPSGHNQLQELKKKKMLTTINSTKPGHNSSTFLTRKGVQDE